MKHILLFLFLASCISPAFAQKAKTGKYKKARVKTEISKLPLSYNPIPESMPAINTPRQPTVYYVETNTGCQLQGLNISCGTPDGTIYHVDGLMPVRRADVNFSNDRIDQVWFLDSGLSAKYSGLPEDD